MSFGRSGAAAVTSTTSLPSTKPIRVPLSSVNVASFIIVPLQLHVVLAPRCNFEAYLSASGGLAPQAAGVEVLRSGRNTARSALGGEFPTCTLSVCAVGS